MEYFHIEYGSLQYTLVIIALYIVAIIAITFLIKRMFRRLALRLSEREDKKGLVGYLNFFKYIVLAVVYVIFLSSLTDYFPTLSSMANKLLAGSGVVAVIMGLASQDALGNFTSGIMIIFTKPFKVGDTIRYLDKNLSGVVESINIRHTVIRTFENKRVIVQNSTINNTVIENYNYLESEHRICNFFDISITYESDLKKAIEVLADEADKIPELLDIRSQEDIDSGVPKVKVLVTNFADSSIVLRAWLWSEDAATGALIKSKLYQSLLDRYRVEGIEFAYPQLVVHTSE